MKAKVETKVEGEKKIANAKASEIKETNNKKKINAQDSVNDKQIPKEDDRLIDKKTKRTDLINNSIRAVGAGDGGGPIKSASQTCSDKDCPFHGNLKTRGRTFEGKVIRKFPKRIVIEFERMVYVRKYERYTKSRTKIHARLPICIEKEINIGDFVKVQECRPLSKLIHFVVIGKVNEKETGR